MHLVGFYYKNISRCTVLWISNPCMHHCWHFTAMTFYLLKSHVMSNLQLCISLELFSKETATRLSAPYTRNDNPLDLRSNMAPADISVGWHHWDLFLPSGATLYFITHCAIILHVKYTFALVGRDNSVGIATRYWLDGPGIESRWGGEIFRNRPDRPWGPHSLLYNGYRVFPGGKAVGAWRWQPTPSKPRLKKE